MNISRLPLPRLFRVVLIAALTALAMIQSGCIAVVAAAGAGTGVAWYNGRLDATVEAGLDEVYRASQRALSDLEFAKISENKSALDALLVSRTALDKKVEIKLTKPAEGATKVSIRVGVFGDEELSMAILEKIKARL